MATNAKSVLSILPGTAGLNRYSGKLVWEKNGGYADAVIRATLRKATAAGFTRAEWTPSGSPDGNVVGSGTVYRDAAGSELVVRASYGVTARDNRFSITLKPAPWADPAWELRARLELAGYAVVSVRPRGVGLRAFCANYGPAGGVRANVAEWDAADPESVRLINTETGAEVRAAVMPLPALPGREVARG